MKKLLFATLILTSFAGLAGASILYSSPCSVLEGANSGPFLSGICSATADPGFFISSVTVTLTSDYTGFQSGNPIVTDTYTFATNTAGFGAIPNGVVTTTANHSNPIQNFNVTLIGNFGSSVTESFNMSNTVSGGVVTGTSGVMTITALETAIAGVPEPATMGLVGSALMGLGFLSLKKRTPKP